MPLVFVIVAIGALIGITESAKSETERTTTEKYCHGPRVSPRCPNYKR